MPFPINFTFPSSITEKIVPYTGTALANQWTIKSVSIGPDIIDKKRWWFTDVKENPAAPGSLIGTLHFNSADLSLTDIEDAPLLEALNAGSATLNFNVLVNNMPRPLVLVMS